MTAGRFVCGAVRRALDSTEQQLRVGVFLPPSPIREPWNRAAAVSDTQPSRVLRTAFHILLELNPWDGRARGIPWRRFEMFTGNNTAKFVQRLFPNAPQAWLIPVDEAVEGVAPKTYKLDTTVGPRRLGEQVYFVAPDRDCG